MYKNLTAVQAYLVLLAISLTCDSAKALEEGYSNQTDRPKRQAECPRSKYRCTSGECVERLYLCDGVKTCRDASDENFETCKSIACPDSTFTFRCDYGACISSYSRCNGVNDCWDGSDEKDCATQNGCELPEHQKYGKFVINSGAKYVEHSLVSSSTIISLKCDGDYSKLDQTEFYCLAGQWRPPINTTQCRKPGTCPTIKFDSTSEELFCRYNNAPVSCEEPMEGTTVTVRCQPFYTTDIYRPIHKCANGKWDWPFTSCYPECGQKSVGAKTLIIGGGNAVKNEYPWVAAVYNQSNHQICGSTIISRRFVLSAAHCFSSSNGKPKDKSAYTIVAGRYHRDLSVIENSSQTRKIELLYIHEDYRGSLQRHRDDIALLKLDEAFILTHEVQPICIDWENSMEDSDFIDGKEGVVTGWGNTLAAVLPSDILKKLIVPFRSRDVCLRELPQDFQQKFYTSDKICAGYKNKSSNVCSGDSGGGLYFKSDNERYYIRGIVSLAVNSEVGCDANTFALYTRVSKYLSWLEARTRRVL